MTERKVRHAHELEAAGDARWSAKLKDGLLLVTDEASGEEVQATAYTKDGEGIRFALPGENGLRLLRRGEPGYEEFEKVLDKTGLDAPAAKASSKPANERGAAETRAAS